jgi:hypothetical protein
LYGRLEEAARKSGLQRVEEYLERLKVEPGLSAEELRERRETVEWTDALRARMFEKYGEMPDSADLLREDRER